jgi:hypothetical protein
MMNRRIRVSLDFLVAAILLVGLTLGMTCKKKNQPPGAPSTPSGPTSGRKGDSLRFSTVAEDPDGDSVSVRFDWGDSTVSDWSALVPSGDSVVMTHVWQKLGTYSIRAQARDTKETASVWSGEHQLTIASFLATFGGTNHEEGHSVQRTSDGGYVVTGRTTSYGAGDNDVWLIKTDASGNEVWDKTFGGTRDDAGNSVQQTFDGGYVVIGYTMSYGAGFADFWLIKTDASGNKVWDKTFGGTGDDVGRAVQQTSDGGYILTGYADSHTRAWLIKTDADGSEVWKRAFGGSGYEEGFCVQQTSDGGYVVTGITEPLGGTVDVLLVKTDADGNKVWDRAFGGTATDEEGYSVRQTSDGGYVVTGNITPQGSDYDDVWLIKTDADGNKVWDRAFGGIFIDDGFCVQQTSDGGYVITGDAWSYGTGNYDVWLIKTDASGNEIWDRTFGGAGYDAGNSVQQTSDGGYIIAGYTDSYGAGNGDVWLIKTDADGN